MRRAVCLFFPLFLVFMSPHRSLFAQGLGNGPHEIKGTVFAPGNAPAKQVRIVLEDRMGTPLLTSYTDDDGRYIFGRLGFGSYRIVVPAFARYRRAWQEIEISGSRNSIIIRTVNLYLSLKGEARSRRASGTVSAFRQEVPAKAQQEYNKAVKALKKGSRKKCIAHLKQALKIFAGYFLALSRLGIEYARAGDFGDAVPVLRRACQINRYSVISCVTLGMSLVELGQFEEAIQRLTVGKSLNPRSVNAHLYLGIAQLQVGEVKRAEANLRRAYELGGAQRAATAHLYLASMYDQQGRYRRAADELKAYLRDVPRSKNAAKIRRLIQRLRKKSS